MWMKKSHHMFFGHVGLLFWNFDPGFIQWFKKILVVELSRKIRNYSLSPVLTKKHFESTVNWLNVFGSALSEFFDEFMTNTKCTK